MVRLDRPILKRVPAFADDCITMQSLPATGRAAEARPVAPPDLSSFEDFTAAARGVLQFLAERVPMRLWMVTRVEGHDDWVVVDSADRGYGIDQGDVFRWSASLCSRMAAGAGPRLATRTSDVPAYAEAPMAAQMTIAAHVGVPLLGAGGALYGTICGLDPAPRPELDEVALATVEVLARLLSTSLALEARAMEEIRRAERAEAGSLVDPLTGLFNARGWARLIDSEEDRCRRYGMPASIMAVDLDGLARVNEQLGRGAGDELLRRTARALVAGSRASDIAARVGEDEFFMLLIDCPRSGAEAVFDRVQRRLGTAGVLASVGVATRFPNGGLDEASRDALEEMRRMKRFHATRRRQNR